MTNMNKITENEIEDETELSRDSDDDANENTIEPYPDSEEEEVDKIDKNGGGAEISTPSIARVETNVEEEAAERKRVEEIQPGTLFIIFFFSENTSFSEKQKPENRNFKNSWFLFCKIASGYVCLCLCAKGVKGH